MYAQHGGYDPINKTLLGYPVVGILAKGLQAYVIILGSSPR